MHNRDTFSSLSNMRVCCVFSLESPHRGDSNEYTQHTIINIKRKSPEIISITIKSADRRCFVRDQARDRTSRGKRATEVPL